MPVSGQDDAAMPCPVSSVEMPASSAPRRNQCPPDGRCGAGRSINFS
jgi:hypothetical protein